MLETEVGSKYDKPILDSWKRIPQPKIQGMLIKHCLVELNKCNLYEVYKIVNSFELPFHSLLVQISSTKNTMAWHAKFDAIHDSFDLPRPSDAKILLLNSHAYDAQGIPALELMLQNRPFFTVTQDRLLRVSPTCHKAIQFFMESFMQAQWTEYALYMATLLVRIDIIQQLLQNQPHLTKFYVDMLHHEQYAAGYSQLRSLISKQ